MIRILTAALVAIAASASSEIQDDRPSESPRTHASATAAPAAGLVAENLYNGVKRPVVITVTSPRSFGIVTLALMDFDGKLLADTIDVHPGRVDLAEKLPAIWQMRRAGYLQMIDGEEPIGPALVIQPMLSRMIPVTRVERRPNGGAPYSRISGWMDENDPVAQAPPAQPPPTTAPRFRTDFARLGRR